MPIINTFGGGQMDVSPLLQYNINAQPLFGNGMVGNVTDGARLNAPRSSGFWDSVSAFFGAAGSVAGAGASVFNTGQRQLGDTARQVVRTGAGVGANVIADSNNTIRSLGDNVEGTAKAGAASVISYSAAAIILLLLIGAILYVPMTGLKKAGA